jgi:L,D-transpeptidase YcbB
MNTLAPGEKMRLTIRALILFVMLIAGKPALAAGGGNAPNYEDVSAAIVEMLNSPERMALPIERVRQALKAHYITNAGTIYWVGTGRMTPLIQRLEDAQFDGLNPDDYPIDTLIDVRDSIDANDVQGAAKAELYYSAFFVAYAADLKIGRISPQKVDPSLFRNRKTIDVLRVLTDLKKQRDPGKFLSAFEPHNEHYQALKKMMRAYSGFAEQGSWPIIDQGAVIKPGMSDPRVTKVRNMLAMTGDYEWQVTSSPVYDQKLAIAVQRFQQRNGLEAKGLLGKQSIIALNITPNERVKQIMLNMERWRWMPDNMGEEHILVNIAAFELQRVQSSVIVERMNVVTGAVATQTPEFSDEMEYVELNPTWTVPYNIATGEMLPKLRANPYNYASDFDVFKSGTLTSWDSIDWNAYGPGRFPFTFRQHPGPKNALGKVKFMLPNVHNIYLHDTPAKDKFASTSRAFSHGCIRLSRPMDLAHEIIGEIPGWSAARVDSVVASGVNTKVVLPRKIPVHLIYATAFKGENGIEFRPDVYGRDRKLYNALFGRSSS